MSVILTDSVCFAVIMKSHCESSPSLSNERKTSNALNASVQSEQMCFQKSAEAVSGDTRISQIVRQ